MYEGVRRRRTTRTLAHMTSVATTDFPPGISPSQLLGLLITDSIQTQIIEYSNQRLELIRGKYKRQCKPELKEINSAELDVFIGLLIFGASFKSNDEDINAFFATDGT